jgi:hypothetical protein
MLANTFSHGLIRDYVVSFGTLFNNIKINRTASSGESDSTIAVPLTYSPQQRYIARINEDLGLDKPVAITLPRMSFELIGMTYSTERKLNTMHRLHRSNPIATSNTNITTSYSPVPYDFQFQISVYVSNIEDGTHIVEQILPYFTPEFTVSLKSATALGVNLDLPIILNSVVTDDNYEGSFDGRRVIVWTLDFTLKGNLFGYMSGSSGIINKAYINLHPTMNTAPLAANGYDQIAIQPAMFANGSPTTNAAASVPVNQINANDTFGIATDIYNIY